MDEIRTQSVKFLSLILEGRHSVLRTILYPFSIACAFIFALSTYIQPLHARCGYYAGYGYRCFGDKGGTGGKVFKQMDENSQKCGYWDPGCTKANSKTTPQGKQNYSPPQSDQNYNPPQDDNSYKSPTIGPGYEPPGS